MSKSFNTIYTKCQNVSGDDSDAMLTRFKEDINDTVSIVLGDHEWKHLERTRDITTVASTARYELSADLRKIIGVTTTPDSGTTLYRPQPVDDPAYWEYLQSLNAGDSDVTQHYYQEGNDLLIWPSYSTAGNTITVRFRKRPIEMTLADYTAGGIAGATNASTAITGSSTVWGGPRASFNEYLQITKVNTTVNGDGRWYPIASYTTNIALVLEKEYLGTTFSSSAFAYTIGEFPLLPAEYHNIPFYRTMALFYMGQEDFPAADRYWRLYDGGYEQGLTDRPAGMVGQMIKEQAGMLDSKYFPPQGSKMPISPEDLSLDSTFTFG